MSTATMQETESQLRDVIERLYFLMVQAKDYEGPSTAGAMARTIQELIHDLCSLSRTSHNLDIGVPPEIINDYVNVGRNPDIYTREFVELVQRANQDLKGKSEAFKQFRDVLAADIVGAMPGIRGEVERMVEESNGVVV